MDPSTTPDRRDPAAATDPAGRLEQRMEALEAERDRIFADEAAGRLAPADARAAHRSLQAREDALEAKIRRLEAPENGT